MTLHEIAAREGRIIDHIAVILKRHPGSATRREALTALLDQLDSQGKGPSGRIKIGRKVAYPVNSLIVWLQGRAKALS